MSSLKLTQPKSSFTFKFPKPLKSPIAAATTNSISIRPVESKKDELMSSTHIRDGKLPFKKQLKRKVESDEDDDDVKVLMQGHNEKLDNALISHSDVEKKPSTSSKLVGLTTDDVQPPTGKYKPVKKRKCQPKAKKVEVTESDHSKKQHETAMNQDDDDKSSSDIEHTAFDSFKKKSDRARFPSAEPELPLSQVVQQLAAHLNQPLHDKIDHLIRSNLELHHMINQMDMSIKKQLNALRS